MFQPLRNPAYRRLLAAQVVALIGTGFASVALGLLAYDLAGAEAGAVLGTALAIKMVAYVGVAPLAGAVAERLPRRGLLVGLDLVRCAMVAWLPFVTEVWQVYLLIFLLQSASAAFTPAFQATIPEILRDERDYTRALSLSRLAYDLESLLSPVLAAVLLGLIGFHWLFAGTALGFLLSAALVLSAALPVRMSGAAAGSFARRVTRGMRIYLATPRLRGLLALNMAAAAAGAMVIVNSVVIVQGLLGRGAGDVAYTLAAFGGGSMLGALVLPPLLDRVPERAAMVAGGGVLAVGLGFAAASAAVSEWRLLLAVWALLGLGYALVLTPTGRLLRRSAREGDRPALFAAQFALSHACWLITYPLAGWLGAAAGIGPVLIVLAMLAGGGTLAAVRLWPRRDPEAIEHTHPELALGHPHLREAAAAGPGARHTHVFVIDDTHPYWPR